MITNTYHLVTNHSDQQLIVTIIGRRDGKHRKFIIDPDQEALARKHRWNINGKEDYWYVMCLCHQKILHRLITNAGPHEVVDHINHHTTDNRRANLRIGTQGENMKNRKPHKSNKHQNLVPGVTWNNPTWRVILKVNGIKRNGGRFDTLPEAICSRIRLEYEWNGVHSPNYRALLNKMPRDLLLVWFHEIYGKDNYFHINGPIWTAHYKNKKIDSPWKRACALRKVGLTTM